MAKIETENCPVPQVSLLEFEQALYSSLEYWSWIIPAYPVAALRRLIDQDKRKSERATVAETVSYLRMLSKMLADYSDELEKQ